MCRRGTGLAVGTAFQACMTQVSNLPMSSAIRRLQCQSQNRVHTSEDSVGIVMINESALLISWDTDDCYIAAPWGVIRLATVLADATTRCHAAACKATTEELTSNLNSPGNLLSSGCIHAFAVGGRHGPKWQVTLLISMSLH